MKKLKKRIIKENFNTEIKKGGIEKKAMILSIILMGFAVGYFLYIVGSIFFERIWR